MAYNKLHKKDFTIAVKTGTDANKTKFAKESAKGELYFATDSGSLYGAQTEAGTSDSTIFNIGSASALSVLTTKTSNYTVQASDLGKVIKMSSSTAILEVTLPSGLGSGFRCTIVQEGTVKCKVLAGSGVSLNNWNSQLHTAGQYGAINVFAYDSNIFLATGDVGDAPAALLGYPNNAIGNTSTLYTITTQPQYHFDASEASTITESGGAVSAWGDISGNGRSSAQATSANQPIYTASGQNSKSYINFDGTNDYLTIANSLSFTGASTYILVTDSSSRINGLSEDPNSGASEFFTMSGSTLGRFGSGGSHVVFTASASTSGFAILTYQNDGSSNVVFDLNGSTTELATSSSGLINSSYPVVANSIGHGGSFQNYHNGKIYEIIAFNTKLETSNLSDLNIIISYLAAKYNVSLGSF